MSYSAPLKERLVFNLLYKWKYLWAILKAGLFYKKSLKTIEKIVYVAREADKDWIFGTKVRRLSEFSQLSDKPYFHDRLQNLPEADGYFFIYPHYFCRAIRHNPQILNKKNIVMFTHPHWTNSYSRTHVIWCLNKAHKVICLNSEVKRELIDLGLKPEKLEIMHLASDPEFFYAHKRTGKGVGFCSGYGKRKNAQLIYNLIKHMPEKHFYIIGRHWEKYEHYDEMINASNFTYFNDQDYNTFNKLYSQFDTFISPSLLEGGPVPLLEAMLSNCFPIATKTGFAPDIIEHGKNGFLIETTATYKDVIPLINQADKMKDVDIRSYALPYSWKESALKIDQLFFEK